MITSASGAPRRRPTANFSANPRSGPEPLTVRFTDTSTSRDGITSREWDFDSDGVVDSAETNPIHMYDQDGTYTVTLRVYESDGDSDTETKAHYVTVTDTEPRADFNATPTSGLAPLQVSFTDTSTSYDGIAGWTWNFGDGQSSEEQNPNHVYAADGTYTVILMVLEEDGSDDVKTKMNYITVTDTAPKADFSYSQDTAPLTISFTDQSTSYDEIVSWFWDFGDGQTSTEQNPTHKFPDDGNFNVRLTVTDDDGSTDTISKQVALMNSPPTADFDIVSSEKPTVNEDISFIDQSSDPDGDIVSWFWDLGDGTNSTAQNVTHRYQALGTYIVSLTITDNDGATDTASKNITIYDVTPPVTIDDYDGLWHNTDFTITLTATDDLSGVAETYYRINEGPIRNVGTHGQPLITTESANNRLEYWSVDNAGNEETHHIVWDIKLDKTSPTAVAEPDLVIDEDTSMTFDGSASTDNIGITSYTWVFFDEAPQTLTGVNPTYTFYAPGVYTVSLTVTDAALNDATDTLIITVRDITEPIANAGDDQVVHEDVAVAFDGSASTDNVGIISYVWTFTDGTLQTLFGVNPSYTFETPGVYTVTLNVTDAEGHFTTDTVVITVRDVTPPLIEIGNYATVVENAPVNFDASGSYDNVGIIDYQWDFGDGTFENSTIPSVIHTYTKPGVYTVILTVVDETGNVNSASISIVVYRDTDRDFLADYLDADDDNDGMPDDWEILHGLDPLDPSDASLDRDGDGFSNLTEYQMDSNPNVYTSPSPFPLFVMLTIATTGFIFSGVLFVRIRRREHTPEETRKRYVFCR
jgi:PKD repeat protein